MRYGCVIKWDCCFLCIPVNCPPGTYSNGTDCVPCLQGEYQDEEGQTECKPCPADKTTSFPGATNLTDCEGKTVLSHWQLI